jgi:hypothetical protein
LGKVITMSSSNPQATSSNEAPFTQGDIRNLSIGVDIYRSLGGLQEAVDNLKAANKSNIEKIEQLTQWVFAIPNLEKSVAQNAKDLNEVGRRHDKDIKELEKVVHTASTFGKIALGVATPVAAGIIVAVLIYLSHLVAQHVH